jgi:SnoaL-like domain
VTVEPNRVDRLAAMQEIKDVLRAYCRGLDRMDRALAESVWHPDGTADYGPGYRGSGTGFLDFVWEYHATFAAHSHMLGNELVKVDLESATASSEAYVAVWLRTPPQDGVVTDLFHRGRYVDQWSRRDGVWAVDHRSYVGDLAHEARHELSPAATGPANWGTRDRADLSYTAFP